MPSDEDPLLVRRRRLLCPHRWRQVCGVCSIRALVPSWGSTLITSPSPKVPPPNTLRIRGQPMRLGDAHSVHNNYNA